jgi:hypothetical protein
MRTVWRAEPSAIIDQRLIDPLWFVEADEHYALLFAAAARCAGLERARHFGSGAQLQQHLATAFLVPMGADTLPRLIVIDAGQGDLAALALVAWLRREPAIAHVSRVVWADRLAPSAYAALGRWGGVRTMDKPAGFGELVEAVGAMAMP